MKRLLLLSVGLLMSATSLQATILHVPSEITTIQAAIDSCPNDDTILVAPGTYYESLVFWYSNPVTVMAQGGRDSTILQSPGGAGVVLFREPIDTTTVYPV